VCLCLPKLLSLNQSQLPANCCNQPFALHYHFPYKPKRIIITCMLQLPQIVLRQFTKAKLPSCSHLMIETELDVQVQPPSCSNLRRVPCVRQNDFKKELAFSTKLKSKISLYSRLGRHYHQLCPTEHFHKELLRQEDPF